MQINADLIARYMLRMAAEIEALTLQRDALAEENDKLRQEAENVPRETSRPKIVPSPEEGA